MASLILSILIVAFVTGFAAQVVSEDKITAPIREWIFARGWHPGKVCPDHGERLYVQRWYWKFLGGVVECYRCSGVWLSLLATMVVLNRHPFATGRREFVIVWFAASFIQFSIHTVVLLAQEIKDDPKS